MGPCLKGDAGAFHCHICAGAYGDAHVGSGQSGRVVHTVARHGDLVAVAA